MNVNTIHDPIVLKRPVATIGIFDGVHSGHRFILDHLCQRARDLNGDSVAVTLWPHPQVVLNRGLPKFKLLHTREEKLRELEKSGIDQLVIVPFDMEIASLTACEFTQQYLVNKLGIHVLLVGYDNRFGRDRKGDPEGLARCADQNRFRIEKLPEFNSDLGRISSTTIREAISSGDLGTANQMLGYDYYLAGNIVEGNHVGRELGFPTANVHPMNPYKLIPMNGVYAVRVELKGRLFGGMLNIGFRPTLDSASAVKTIEAHLFEAAGDFYGEHVVVHFVKRVREEMKFSGKEELKKQLDKDRTLIRNMLL
jgi:riboflavin kinase/FMN adenylyltransferase